MNQDVDLTWFDSVVQNYIILVDTSIFMSEGADKFFYKILAPYLRIHEKYIIVPYVAIKELENNIKKENTKLLAERGYKILKEFLKYKLLKVKYEKTDTHPDQVFKMVYAKHGVHKNLAFLTNDKKLARELCDMYNSKSVQTRYKLLILGINSEGIPYKLCQNGYFKTKKKKKFVLLGLNGEEIDQLAKKK